MLRRRFVAVSLWITGRKSGAGEQRRGDLVSTYACGHNLKFRRLNPVGFYPARARTRPKRFVARLMNSVVHQCSIVALTLACFETVSKRFRRLSPLSRCGDELTKPLLKHGNGCLQIVASLRAVIG